MEKEQISRRDFLRGSSVAGLTLMAKPVAGVIRADASNPQNPPRHESLQPAGNTWGIPACAWKRPLGSLPGIDLMPEPLEHSSDISGLNTRLRTKKGVPLGGIGAGNFMYNLCGTFGPWQLKVGRYEERFLSQAAFHIREKVEGKDATVRTLATDDVLSAWMRLKPAEGAYYALFPRGWCTFNAFQSIIASLFLSPIIIDNYR